jgi:hypothetical protein
MHNALIEVWVAFMVNKDILVAITASREKGEIVYRVECASSLTNEEFEYYLEEMLKGICKWKPGICEENLRSFKGTIREKKKMNGIEKIEKET